MAATFYQMFITVKSIEGHCDAGMKVGDKFEIMGPRLVQGGICVSALSGIYPYVNAMKYGDPWILQGKDVLEVCCSDPKNLVTFEISRVKMDGDRPPDVQARTEN